MSNLDRLKKFKFLNYFVTPDGARLNDMLAQVTFPLQPTVVIPDTTHTLAASDNGQMLLFTNAAGCTLTLPANLPAQFNCAVVQLGAAQVTFAAGAGAAIGNVGSFTKTSALYGVASLVVYANVGGSAAQAITFGSMA